MLTSKTIGAPEGEQNIKNGSRILRHFEAYNMPKNTTFIFDILFGRIRIGVF